jgi:hypothetical protein
MDYRIVMRGQYRGFERAMHYRKLRTPLIVALVSLLAAWCLSILLYSTVSQAEAGEHKVYKYYKCITVPSGASLWSLSEDYMDVAYYESVSTYMNEVRHINRLDTEDTLLTGQSLILPYYSSEYIP